MVKTGLVGIGYWGKILRPKLESISDLRFVNSGRNLEEYQKFLKDVDWVFIATPNETHYDLVKKCLETGLNVFCEKPLTTTRKKSEELYAISNKLNLVLYVDNVFLFRDESKALAQAMRKDSFEKIRFETRKYGSFKSSLFNNATYHDLCILYQLFGNLDFTNLHFDQNKEDRKQFSFLLEGLKVEFVYDRLYNGKEKKIFLDNRLFDYSYPTNDALEDMIKQVLSHEVDVDFNKRMCLEVEGALEKLSSV